jgi:hypothetical protein
LEGSEEDAVLSLYYWRVRLFVVILIGGKKRIREGKRGVSEGEGL